MEEIEVDSVHSLEGCLSRFEEETLFRGQTDHYTTKAGDPSINTSFDRKGCIPQAMMRWSHYAGEILNHYFGLKESGLEYNQAILQHYGWRSFFVDCSSNSAVGAWFASHSYREEDSGQLCEDYEERPVHLERKRARYSFTEGKGHLYVLCRDSCARMGLVDLSNLNVADYRTRPSSQAGWLIGPTQGKLISSDHILAHITGERSIFRDFAKNRGVVSTEDLFPPPQEDPIFSKLLSLPWKSIGWIGKKDTGIPVLRRSLELPEYTEALPKTFSRSVAFYTGTSIGSEFPPPIGEKKGVTIPMPSEMLTGSTDLDEPLAYPSIFELVKKHGSIAFEVDDLFQASVLRDSSRYQKGVGVFMVEKNLLVVSELTVEHPGLDPVNVAFARGWFFRVEDSGTWVKVDHPEQCDCTDKDVHVGHLKALKIASYYLDNRK